MFLNFWAWHRIHSSFDFILLIEREEEFLSLASNSCANRLNSRTQRGNNTSRTWAFASSNFTFTNLRVVSGGFAVAGVIVLHLVEPARNLSSPVRFAIVRSRRSGRPRASDILSHGKSTCKSIVDLWSIKRTALALGLRSARILWKTLVCYYLRGWDLAISVYGIEVRTWRKIQIYFFIIIEIITNCH